ncbi:MAG: putative histidine kinase, hybrid [Ramlibacter sp.]|nr:putative histidine kinase, hybrid [Ramlibacter sp.]
MTHALDRIKTRLERYWPVASLRTYLVAVILLATFPIATLMCVRMFMEVRSEQAQIESSLARSAAGLAQAVESELSSSFDALGVLAQSELLQHADQSQLEQRLGGRPRPRRDWDSFFVVNGSGRILLDTARSPADTVAPEVQQLLHAVLEHGQPAASGLIHGPGAHVVLAVPVNVGGLPRYVVAARIGAAVWQRLADGANPPPGGVATLLGPGLKVISATGELEGAPAAPLAPETAEAMRSEPAAVHRSTAADGSALYSAWRLLPSSGWGVRVSLPAAPIDAGHRRAILGALSTGGASLLLGVLLAALAARRVTTPLHQLALHGPAGLDGPLPVHEIALLRKALLKAKAKDQAARARLEAKAQEFEALFNSSPIGMAFAQDPGCQVVSHNPAMDQMLTPEGPLRPSVRLLHRGRLLEPDQFPLRRAAALGETVLAMELEIAIDGQPSTFVIANAVPLRDQRGRPRGAVTALVDITERKRVEARLLTADVQLRESQRLMELAQEAGHVGFFHYQFAGDQLAWTPGQFKLFGIDSLGGGRLADWFGRIDGADRDRIEREFWTACALRRDKETLEYCVVRPDGTSRWLSSRVMLRYDGDGGAHQMTGITVDMSDQKEAERQRTLLTERALAARLEAEAASRAKDEFLTMLSHELRNPLGAISAAVDVLESADADSDTAAEARAIIARQTRNLSHMMNDLLDVGRVIAGKTMLSRQPVDIAAIAGRVQQTVALTGAAANHRLQCDLRPTWIDGDAVRIEQIVSNLLTNALKYTPPGGDVALAVRREGETALIEVRDSGEGIPAALLPHIFDLFVQGERTLDRRAGGLGIGLTLVRRLVELHGGTVGVESSAHGSKFTVRLPAVEPVVAALADDALPMPRRRNVLVVEDNEDVLAALRSKLELDGHSVSTAADGVEGLTRLLKLRPEVSIVDIGLPGITGFELARHARAAGYAGRMIAMSGYGHERDMANAMVAGFDAYLVKPVDRLQLRASLSAD